MGSDEVKPGCNLGMRRLPIEGELEELVAQFSRTHRISLGVVGVMRIYLLHVNKIKPAVKDLTWDIP